MDGHDADQPIAAGRVATLTAPLHIDHRRIVERVLQLGARPHLSRSDASRGGAGTTCLVALGALVLQLGRALLLLLVAQHLRLPQLVCNLPRVRGAMCGGCAGWHSSKSLRLRRGHLLLLFFGLVGIGGTQLLHFLVSLLQRLDALPLNLLHCIGRCIANCTAADQAPPLGIAQLGLQLVGGARPLQRITSLLTSDAGANIRVAAREWALGRWGGDIIVRRDVERGGLRHRRCNGK